MPKIEPNEKRIVAAVSAALGIIMTTAAIVGQLIMHLSLPLQPNPRYRRRRNLSRRLIPQLS